MPLNKAMEINMMTIRFISSGLMTFPGLFLLTLMIALNHGLMDGQYGFTLADILVKFSESNYVWFAASLSFIIGYLGSLSVGASSGSTESAFRKYCRSKLFWTPKRQAEKTEHIQK